MPDTISRDEDMRDEVRLPREIRYAWMLIVLMSAASVLYSGFGHFLGTSFHSRFPLSGNEERFGDFTVFWRKFDYFHSAGFFTHGFPFSYPAPVAVMYQFFLHHAGPHPLAAFLAFCVVALVVPAAWFGIALGKSGVGRVPAALFAGTLLVFSWPGILELDRANMEILVWCALCAACWAYATGRGDLAATLFGLAAALKLFPFVFFGLFLSTRDWRRLLIALVSFSTFSVLSLAALGPTIGAAFNGIRDGLTFFRHYYMGQWHSMENEVDHSLFAFFKATMLRFGHPANDFHRSLSIYILCVPVVGLLLYAFRIRRLPLLNQLLIFCIVSIYFTPFSGDGTLLHLYSPLALLLFLAVGAARAKVRVPALLTAILLLATLETPVSFLRVGNQFLDGQFRAVLLACLLVVALRYPFGPSLDEAMQTRRPLFEALVRPRVDGTALPLAP